jgi:adenylate cyclase
LGDTVNLASRLEQANTHYGTCVLASASVVARGGDKFVWREIDTIRVRGRSTPVTIFEPLARSGKETEAQRARAQAYADGLSAWRELDFSRAEHCFSTFPDDPPASMFKERCERALAEPLDAGSSPVFNVPPK